MTEPKNSFADYPPSTAEEAKEQERIVYGPIPWRDFKAALQLFKKVEVRER